MSTSITKNCPVIVRAWGDEPVRLRALATGKGFVEVAGSDDELSLGWPIAFAYCDSDELFEALRGAYERGDVQGLARSWGQAKALASH